MPLYGKVTPEILGNMFAGLGVENDHLARLLVYLVDKIRTADRMLAFEQEYINNFLLSIGIDEDLNNVLVVQVSQKEVTQNVFGHPQTTARAWDKLRNSGIVEEVLKGFPGHSSIFLLGLINSQIMNDDVSEDDSDNRSSLTDSECSLTNCDEVTHNSEAYHSQSNSVIRDDAATSKVVNPKKAKAENKPEGGTLSLNSRATCPHCGCVAFTFDERTGCYYCPDCGYVAGSPATFDRGEGRRR